MVVDGSVVAPPQDGSTGLAPGYMDAMHGLCIPCHEQALKEAPDEHCSDFAECAACHRDADADRLHRMKPYLANP